MNPLALPNVTIAQALHAPDGSPPSLTIKTQLSELMWSVASTNPLWELRIVNARSNSVQKVRVYHDGEALGEIGVDYYGNRGISAVYVVNHRISATRQRNNGRQYSEDNKRLMSAIKKNFSRKTVAEKVNTAVDEATRALNSTVWDLNSKASRLMHTLYEPALSYVLGAGRDLFAQHLMAIGESQHIAKLDEVQEADIVAKTGVAIKDLYDKNKLALVILDNDKYIVKYAVNTETHNGDSFPASLRRSLGMLKLVEKGQIVSNSGMRVDENVFILVQDE